LAIGRDEYAGRIGCERDTDEFLIVQAQQIRAGRGKHRHPRALPRGVGLGTQIVWLLVLALPVACVAWTVTHEEVFSDWRDWCLRRSRNARSGAERKFFYLFSCEYCFSHYVAALAVALTGLRLLMQNWVGYAISWLALVWVANQYMSVYGHLRLDIRKERVEIKEIEQEVKQEQSKPHLEKPAA
jgi:hypothetical protein